MLHSDAQRNTTRVEVGEEEEERDGTGTHVLIHPRQPAREGRAGPSPRLRFALLLLVAKDHSCSAAADGAIPIRQRCGGESRAGDAGVISRATAPTAAVAARADLESFLPGEQVAELSEGFEGVGGRRCGCGCGWVGGGGEFAGDGRAAGGMVG